MPSHEDVRALTFQGHVVLRLLLRCTDLAYLLLDRGLGDDTLASLNWLFAGKDKKHTAAAAVNATGHDCFWAAPLDRTMDKVRIKFCWAHCCVLLFLR